jgi:hypothetical protein
LPQIFWFEAFLFLIAFTSFYIDLPVVVTNNNNFFKGNFFSFELEWLDAEESVLVCCFVVTTTNLYGLLYSLLFAFKYQIYAKHDHSALAPIILQNPRDMCIPIWE